MGDTRLMVDQLDLQRETSSLLSRKLRERPFQLKRGCVFFLKQYDKNLMKIKSWSSNRQKKIILNPDFPHTCHV